MSVKSSAGRVAAGFVSVVVFGLVAASPAQSQNKYAPGTVVLASPMQMASSWNRCVVLEGPNAYDGYQLECADEFRNSSGGMTKTLHKTGAPGKWIKPDDPSFRPDMNLDKVRAEIANAKKAEAAKVAKPATPDGPAKAVAKGAYECWAFSAARMTLNFTILDAKRYKASDGSTSTYKHDPASKQVVFEGYLKKSMPDGFTAIYHEPRGLPTVSFRSARGSEASFCERKK